MSNLTKHDLLHEFPEFRQQIQRLKLTDAHFARLFAEYHDKDHEVHRIESGAETASDDHLENCKKQRLYLKDLLFSMFTQYQARAGG